MKAKLYVVKLFFYLAFLVSIASCKQVVDEGIYPCVDGNCDGVFTIPVSRHDSNDYYHVKWSGYNYFQINGKLDVLNDQYIVNGVPLIETGFDSDYWVFFDTIRFRYPLYSYLGVYSNKRYNDPIPIGSATYTLVDITNLYPPLNIAGYQVQKKFTGWDKPYALTMLGSYSKYTYTPTQNIFISKEMAGDTASIFIRVKFNSDAGRRVTKDYRFNIVFE
jgi:hypothetical protein